MRCAAISKRLQPAASCRCSALETNGRRLSQTGGRAWLKARSSGNALTILLGDVGQQAQLARQAQDHRRFHTLATQASSMCSAWAAWP